MRLTATVRCGPRPDLLRLTPGEGVTIRALELLLQRTGVVRTMTSRLAREVLTPMATFELVLHKARDWRFDIAPDVVESLTKYRQHQGEAKEARTALDWVCSVPENTLLCDFEDRKHLDTHQIQAVAALSHPKIKGICLFDEQGLGKTVMALFAFHRLHQEGAVTRALVLCPKNVSFEWIRDAKRFLPQYSVQAALGTERQKRLVLDRKADIYVTNFESAEPLNIRLRQLLSSGEGKSLLIVDESFFVKNPAAKRTRAVARLRSSSARCFVLCGTPAPNSPLDIVQQFNVADEGVTFNGIQVPDDPTAALPVVRNQILAEGIYLRRLKEGTLSLPNKTIRQLLVSMQPLQKRAYQRALNEMVDALRRTDDLSFRKNLASFAARRMALLQICSNPISVIANYREVPTKLLTLDALLSRLIDERGEKVVLWSFFTASLEAILQRFQRYNPVRLDGKVTDTEQRRIAIHQFQNDHSTMLFVANPAAAGAGITLHRSRIAVYESFSNQAAHYFQSLDRIHRRGQAREVEYFMLLCDNSIELQEMQRLRDKEESSHELLSDYNALTPTRTSMLKDALEALEMLDADRSRGAHPKPFGE